MASTCLDCGEKLIGRSDKKFCNDSCRNSYNNLMNRDVNKLMRNTHNALRKNYRILQKLNPKDKSKTSRDTLLKMGFSFSYITSVYTTKSGTTYFFVYDQGYLPLENDFYALVKRN